MQVLAARKAASTGYPNSFASCSLCKLSRSGRRLAAAQATQPLFALARCRGRAAFCTPSSSSFRPWLRSFWHFAPHLLVVAAPLLLVGAPSCFPIGIPGIAVIWLG